MSILSNAIDSIVLGLQDFESSDDRRLVSCTRNLFSGILLLFKYKLAILSPDGSNEVLLKQRVYPSLDPKGNLLWKGKGKRTVDVNQIKERFDALGISVDWERVRRIGEYRNDIEHYYSELKRESVESIVSSSFLIIRDFISIHLNDDPRKLLGEFAWKVLLEVSEVYEKEKKECVDKLEGLDWKSPTVFEAVGSFACTRCGSDLITVRQVPENIEEAEFECRICNKTYDYRSIVEESLKRYYSAASYFSQADGEESLLTTCPFCFGESYLYSEKICGICGESAAHTCERCGNTIPPEEINDGSLCGYCSHIMGKEN